MVLTGMCCTSGDCANQLSESLTAGLGKVVAHRSVINPSVCRWFESGPYGGM